MFALQLTKVKRTENFLITSYLTLKFFSTIVDLYVSVKSENRVLKKVGLNVRKFRLKQGISQAQLAYEIKTSTKQLQRIEGGEINTGILTLYKIAEALDIKVEELIN